jgi:hypothetical protein
MSVCGSLDSIEWEPSIDFASLRDRRRVARRERALYAPSDGLVNQAEEMRRPSLTPQSDKKKMNSGRSDCASGASGARQSSVIVSLETPRSLCCLEQTPFA